VSRYIDTFRDRFGVEPICRILAVAPSTYYAARTRPPSARALRDAELMVTLAELHRAHFGVYGARKTWRALRRAGTAIGRDRVARLMRSLGVSSA
jgi:putative transposase